jgi:hypothetical protein
VENMRKIISALILFSLLLVSSMVGIQIVSAQVIADGQDFPLAGPIRINSPANITYATNSLVLNVTSKFLLGPEYAKMCYSIDGTNNVTLPLTGIQEPREVERTYENGTTVKVNSTLNVPFKLNGEVALSGLSEGPHHIMVYANYTANTVIGYDESEVYFVIDTNSETSSIPEFPLWAPLLFTFIVLAVAVAIYKRRLHKKQSAEK